MAILKIEGLSIDFGGVQALRNVSLSVDDGSFVGLIGPNGAGKTTLINCVSKIYQKSEGQIYFNGQDLDEVEPHQISQLCIARTFQSLEFFNMIPQMSVMDYIKLGQITPNPIFFSTQNMKRLLISSNEEKLNKNARRILSFFREAREKFEPAEIDRQYPVLHGRGGFPDLIDVEHLPIGSLSFAWRRRLDLARALVMNPKILLLDEPAQGLPPSEMSNLGALLKSIKDEFKVSALIVEHNFHMLTQITDKIVVMDAGQQFFEGTPQQIIENKNVIEVYLGESNKPEEVIEPNRLRMQDKSNQKPILEVKNLDVFYGHAQALFSVSIQLLPRQVISILGTNGSGKSTILRTIAGVEHPRFGEILINGEQLPLGRPEFAAERGIQYVPQGRVLFYDLTVKDNLNIGGFLRQKKGSTLKDDFERIFHYFPKLKEILNIRVSKLSGGQQQILAIAQALMAKPSILLLDEPSLGLSPILVDKVFESIKQISLEEECSILLVEQNVSKALKVSDHVYMLSTGVVMAEGSAFQFQKNSQLVRKNLGFY